MTAELVVDIASALMAAYIALRVLPTVARANGSRPFLLFYGLYGVLVCASSIWAFFHDDPVRALVVRNVLLVFALWTYEWVMHQEPRPWLWYRAERVGRR